VIESWGCLCRAWDLKLVDSRRWESWVMVDLLAAPRSRAKSCCGALGLEWRCEEEKVEAVLHKAAPC
jgi:hypothetical protein